jgi:hypothetical protein
MCIEDVRLGRKTGITQTNVLVGAASGVVLDTDELRSFIIFYPPFSGVVTLSIVDPVVATVGVKLESTDHPLMLDIQQHGQLVTKTWFGIHSVGGVNMCIHQGHLNVK